MPSNLGGSRPGIGARISQYICHIQVRRPWVRPDTHTHIGNSSWGLTNVALRVFSHIAREGWTMAHGGRFYTRAAEGNNCPPNSRSYVGKYPFGESCFPPPWVARNRLGWRISDQVRSAPVEASLNWSKRESTIEAIGQNWVKCAPYATIPTKIARLDSGTTPVDVAPNLVDLGLNSTGISHKLVESMPFSAKLGTIPQICRVRAKP